MGDPFGMVSAGISAATNLAIAQSTNAVNASNVKNTNATNQAIAEQNNATQVAMQRENNAFNHNEAELANQRMIEQWQRETQYNSPIEQVARLAQAGLNPQLAYGGNSVNNVGAASHGAAQANSASSGISPSMPNLIPFQAQMHFPGKDFADIAKALAEAKKTGAEGDLVAESLQDQLRKMKSDADMADLATTFEQIYGGAFRDQKLQKDIKEVQLLTMQAFNLKKQGDLAAAEEVLTKIKQSTERMDSRLKRYQGDTAKLQSETYLTALKAELDLKSAQSSAAFASAALSREEADTVKALRISEVDLNEARVRYTNKQISFTTEQIRHSATDRRRLSTECISIIEDIKGKRMDNEEKSKMLAVIDKQIELDLRQQENFADQQEQDYWNPFRIIGSLLGGAGGAVAVQGMRQNAGKSVVVRGFVP